MGFVSTFSPKFQKKVIKQNIDQYGIENVIHIKKSKLFLWKKILIPFIFWTSVIVVISVLSLPNIWAKWFLWTTIVLFLLLWIISVSKSFKLFLDYKMDFIVVTPRSFIKYDQEWFFKRVSKTIDLKKIRSLSVRKKWFLNSIFNNWNLVVLSEWSENEKDVSMRAGEINFDYLYDPDSIEIKINDLLTRVFYKN